MNESPASMEAVCSVALFMPLQEVTRFEGEITLPELEWTNE